MDEPRPLRVAIVAGEESGDILGADLIEALRHASGREVELVGVGGPHLQRAGLVSLFDAGDIALMGVSAVVRDLPRLIRRIGQTARAIVRARPDCLITVDSPDFSLRVARKVKARDPSIPTIHYVCPSVWAWRPGRASAMRPYVDHILCVLPFEPAELERLSGPPGTYVGHRLSRNDDLQAAAGAQRQRRPAGEGGPRRLLVLPGSRRGEIKSLAGPFGETVDILRRRGNRFEVSIPTVRRVAPLVEGLTSNWSIRPEIILDSEQKWRAFSEADAALACSGTVALELALARVPFVTCYKLDPLARALTGMITTWSTSMPNLIADWPIAFEVLNEFVRPPYLARYIEQLWADTPVRKAQLAGFDDVAKALETPRPAGELAADVVLGHIESRTKP